MKPSAFRVVQPELMESFPGVPWGADRRGRLALLAVGLILAAAGSESWLGRRRAAPPGGRARWIAAFLLASAGLGAAWGLFPAGRCVGMGAATIHLLRARGDEHLAAQLAIVWTDREADVQVDAPQGATPVLYAADGDAFVDHVSVVAADGGGCVDFPASPPFQRRVIGVFEPKGAPEGRFLVKRVPPAGDLELENATRHTLRDVWIWDGHAGWVRMGDWGAGARRRVPLADLDRALAGPHQESQGGWQRDRLLKAVCNWLAPAAGVDAHPGALWALGWSDPEPSGFECPQAYAVSVCDSLWAIRIDPWP